MKKKNGFTLVELLAVIVVLAIIMIIAIPSVLNSMNEARKNSFILYFEKVYNAAVQKYVFDSNLGNLAGAGIYIYDIKQDLDLSSTGDFKGYVVVNNNDVNNVHYIITLYDNNYEILKYDVTASKLPNTKSSELETYTSTKVASAHDSYWNECKTFTGVATPTGKCKTSKNNAITASTTAA